MDYGQPDDVRHALRDVSQETWTWALDEARPGLLSKGSYVLWSLAFDRIGIDDPCDWPDCAHRLDRRPLSGESRERLRMRGRQ